VEEIRTERLLVSTFFTVPESSLFALADVPVDWVGDACVETSRVLDPVWLDVADPVWLDGIWLAEDVVDEPVAEESLDGILPEDCEGACADDGVEGVCADDCVDDFSVDDGLAAL
jgi:hypothetical protein